MTTLLTTQYLEVVPVRDVRGMVPSALQGLDEAGIALEDVSVRRFTSPTCSSRRPVVLRPATRTPVTAADGPARGRELVR